MIETLFTGHSVMVSLGFHYTSMASLQCFLPALTLVWSLFSLDMLVLQTETPLTLGTHVSFLSCVEALVLWVCSLWTVLVLVVLGFFSCMTSHVIFYVIGRSAGSDCVSVSVKP